MSTSFSKINELIPLQLVKINYISSCIVGNVASKAPQSRDKNLYMDINFERHENDMGPIFQFRVPSYFSNFSF